MAVRSFLQWLVRLSWQSPAERQCTLTWDTLADFQSAPWFGVALPALTLNYFGQGGLLLTQPEAVDGLFYHLAPEWSHYGLVILATFVTIIASQAIISGAYSLTQ